MAIVIDGKKLSSVIKDDVKRKVAEFKAKYNRDVTLAVILVGDDPASKIYVENKKKACEAVGIKSFQYVLDKSTSEGELLSLISDLNGEKSVNGILCQLPLPEHIDEQKVIAAISPEKDVDAFHISNVGRIMIGNFDFLPCTPAGIIEILDNYNIDIEGKNCVVIGRSNIVGKPMAMLLMHRNGTVTVCHSKTKNLAEITSKADILVSSVGKANFVTADMVKEGAVVIDVGMNRVGGKLYGDVCFDEVANKASYITPVPGGVGPMTITMLLHNAVLAFERQ